MTDPRTVITVDGAPSLAIDVQPDALGESFVLDVSMLDDPDLLGWPDPADGEWLNIVCDVTRVHVRRGATRLQGPLTRAEAGIATVEVLDADRRFDPIINADAIHAGTPLRVRAWGGTDRLEPSAGRRQSAPNPQAAGGITGWSGITGASGVVTRAAVTGPTPVGSSHARQMWTTATTAVGGGLHYGTTGATVNAHVVAVTAGAPLAVSAYLRPSRAQRLYVAPTFYNAAGGALTTTPGGATVAQAIPANVWTRLGWTGVAPAGAVRCVVLCYAVAGTGGVVWAAGDTLDATGVLVEEVAAIGAYFDGATADDADQTVEGALSYEWTGAANASASRQYVQVNVDPRWDAVLMTASLDDVPVSYPRQGAPRVVLSASDVIADLASWISAGRADPGVGEGDDLLERVHRVLAEVGLPPATVAEDVDTAYAATLAPTILADGWADITDAADAELGRVWVDTANRLVVRGRESLLSGPVRGTLSDWHDEAPTAPHCCYDDLAAALGTEAMVNRAIVARRMPRSDGPVVESAVVQLDDTLSQGRYRKVAALERRDLEVGSDAQLLPWAESILSTSSRPELRIDSVSPAPWTASDQAWRAVCETDIGDRWALRYHPEIGPTVLRTVGVLGVEHTITPGEWLIAWTTVEAPTPGDDNPLGWYLLDESSLDGDDLLAAFHSAQPWRPTYDPATNVFGASSGNLDGTHAALEADALRHLAVGDSITYGQGAATPATQSWPAVLPAKLAALGHAGTVVSNAGIVGSTTADWLATALPPAHTTFAPTITTIGLGTNDAVTGVPPATYAANLAALVVRYKSLGEVLLIAPIPHQIADVAPYVQACYRVAAEQGVPCLDLLARWGSYTARATWYADSTHPNATGYDAIAAAVAGALTP